MLADFELSDLGTCSTMRVHIASMPPVWTCKDWFLHLTVLPPPEGRVSSVVTSSIHQQFVIIFICMLILILVIIIIIIIIIMIIMIIIIIILVVVVVIYITLTNLRTGSEKVSKNAKSVDCKSKHNYTFGFRPGGLNLIVN